VVDGHGGISHAPRSALAEFLRPGDLVIANDDATLPASLRGEHVPSGGAVEVRLAGRRSLAPDDVRRFAAVVFGAGDYRTRTEDRPPPPPLEPGDRLALGPLAATIERRLGHPRLVGLVFDGTPDAIWAGLARHGRPIQYAHVSVPLALWDTWTSIAGPPVAFEAPSAGFALDWHVLAALRGRGVAFATLTHAAGISSTGDAELDRRLPLDEPYRIPPATAAAVRRARARGGHVIAIGTTVVRTLEHAATGAGRVRAGEGLATQRLGPATRLRVVDAILTGTHEPGTSHYELLHAFTDDATLGRASTESDGRGYRTHEFGDSLLIERKARTRARGRVRR
jgi:S-adenosylmethionine:tRNA ribosyltransferase-isomerase